MHVCELHVNQLREQIDTLSPAEILIPKREKEKVFKVLNYYPDDLINSEQKRYIFSKIDDWVYNIDYARELLTNLFGTQSLKGFGIDDMREGLIAAGVINNYLNETQKSNLAHIKKIYKFELQILNQQEFLMLHQ